jgi:ABC-type siderophore export system fused ATPase/permease subunit
MLQSTESKTLSPVRIYAIVGVVAMMVLTVALAVFGAHSTGKARMSLTRVIVFTATALLTCLTIFAMLIARRTPSEAFLAGLLEFSFGFGLLVELDHFM